MPQSSISYLAKHIYKPFGVRDDLVKAHLDVWQALAEAGTWLTGADHVAIMAEVRAAENCQYCDARKQALSPYALQGMHESPSDLDGAWVDAIHRIVTDPARFSKRPFDELVAGGMRDAEYIEMLAVTLFTLAIDEFHRAIGADLLPLPEPQHGTPSRERPAQLDDIGAWIPVLSKKSPITQELFADALRVSNVARAFTLVPAMSRLQVRLIEAQYVPIAQMLSFGETGRVINRTQMELIASRVSALNECFY